MLYVDRLLLRGIHLARGNPKRVGGVFTSRAAGPTRCQEFKEFYCCRQNNLDTKNLELCGMKMSACLPSPQQAESQADRAEAHAVLRESRSRQANFHLIWRGGQGTHSLDAGFLVGRKPRTADL